MNMHQHTQPATTLRLSVQKDLGRNAAVVCRSRKATTPKQPRIFFNNLKYGYPDIKKKSRDIESFVSNRPDGKLQDLLEAKKPRLLTNNTKPTDFYLELSSLSKINSLLKIFAVPIFLPPRLAHKRRKSLR